MFRNVFHAFAGLLLAALVARSAPTADPGSVLKEYQRSADRKQLWLVPDPHRELAGDYIARLRKEATNGTAKAQATLGLCYQLGLGVKPDPAQALGWYQKAAKAGHPGAQNNLGLFYDEGVGVPRDPEKAHELYLTAAKANFADAQFNVGLNYAKGSAVKQDWLEAAAWYRKAVAQGHLPASNNLGNIYLVGRGLPVDLEEAKKYLRPAAEAGFAVSKFGLGMALVQQDRTEEAIPWVRASAEEGYPGGQFLWAAALLEGKGVKRDPKEALKWARRSVDSALEILPEKAADAQAMVAHILLDETSGVPPAPDEAYRRARWAAEKGHAKGQHLLGLCYHRGVGVERDRAAAAHWYQLAAEQKEPTAAFTLGTLYESGGGMPRDYARAAKYYHIAAEAGNSYAQYRLGLSYRDGTGVDIDLAKAATWLRLAAKQTDDREVRDALSGVERQLAKEPAEAEFRRGAELAQEAEKGAGNWSEAYDHLRKAADGGHALATAMVAGMQRRGTGVPPNDAAAEELIAKVEKTTDPVLLHVIGMSYIDHQTIAAKHAARALEFFRRSAVQGYHPAQNTLGFRLMSETGDSPDLIEAFKWLTLSANQGNPVARVNLMRLKPMLNDTQMAESNRRVKSFQPRRE